MAQLMPLPLTVSCFSKIQIGFTILPFLYRLNRVVLEKGPLNQRDKRYRGDTGYTTKNSNVFIKYNLPSARE